MHDNIYTVSELCRETRLLLETSFLTVSIEGEISNSSRPASGHYYFTLKDDKAQIQCVMFRPQLRKIGFKPDNSQHIVMKARVSLYEARGNFQLIVEHMESVGEGALRQKFERLKNTLLNEGLFDTSNKKPLPALARKIGVITSPSGAAIHDILAVLNKRFPSIPVLIYPVSVQGELAKDEIVAAISLANIRKDCDVLLLSRGGGSLEDLWCFNEEAVARAIHSSTIPIVSAVGHEVDFTIADFVADARAATPSAAAEMLSPDQQHWLSRLEGLQATLQSLMAHLGLTRRQQFESLQQRLTRAHPGWQLQAHHQRLDDCHARLVKAPEKHLQAAKFKTSQVSAKLLHNNPMHTIKAHQRSFSSVQHALVTAIKNKTHETNIRFTNSAKALEMLSPLATLSRGYSITKKLSDNTVIHSTQQVKLGDKLHIQLHEGSLQASLEQIDEI
jgi:exodeoxyribonuclease VII large subunit